jgi:branched-chain amino acid transport system ATP-binding protein
MTEVLKVNGLSAGYGPLRVLHDVDFSVYQGERIGLVGLNGHGKSTLFRAITGLVDWQNGSILLNGVEIGGRRTQGPGRKTHKIARQGVALMPQGDAMFIGLTVRQHLDSGAFSRKAWRERAERRQRILEIFPPLKSLMNRPVGKLSGGERRMVTLARGFMGDIKLYLVDEPSLGLSPKISRAVIDALTKIDLSDGAMIIAEQNLQLLEGCVDRMVGMHAGEIKGDVESLDTRTKAL